MDQLCTASCVSKDGYKVVMAMTDKFGGGTTVKVLDLLSNKVLHEITYPDTIGNFIDRQSLLPVMKNVICLFHPFGNYHFDNGECMMCKVCLSQCVLEKGL